jgi:hypothetical protein
MTKNNIKEKMVIYWSELSSVGRAFDCRVSHLIQRNQNVGGSIPPARNNNNFFIRNLLFKQFYFLYRIFKVK